MSPENYVDVCIVAVPTAHKSAYQEHIAAVAAVFRQHGVLEYIECWGDDVPEGNITSLPRAVQCRPDETVVVSWFVWPSKAIRDQGWQAVEADTGLFKELPFDGKRAIYGGFVPLLIEGTAS